MKAGVLIFVVADMRDYLVSKNLLATDGSITEPSITQWAEIAAHVEGTLKAHGIDTPEHIDKVVNALPLFLSLVL